ncbi:MAG: molybdenum cofactor guanylyltransferase [Thermoleophilaceae bacterium]|nr:molybdenum cofactor guanylyltransferase [Thermoleophilaceae bacterium]
MIGVLLAGGRGRRMGGGKPWRELAGRPLIAWPAAALAGACERVVVVAKPGIDLPELPGVARWDEPDTEHHPARGIAFALERAGEPVLVCAADMPFVTADVCRRVAAGLGEGRAAAAGMLPGPVPSAAVAVADGVMQPVLAAYAPAALAGFRAAPPDAALTRTVDALGPVLVEVDSRLARSVDSAEDLAAAALELE